MMSAGSRRPDHNFIIHDSFSICQILEKFNLYHSDEISPPITIARAAMQLNYNFVDVLHGLVRNFLVVLV